MPGRKTFRDLVGGKKHPRRSRVDPKSTRRPASRKLTDGPLFSAFLVAALLILGAPPLAASQPRIFDVPAGDAAQSLRTFSHQSGVQILYPAEQVRGLQTRAVQGNFEPRDALDTMLATTGWIVVQDEASGALLIKRAGPEPAASQAPRPLAPDNPRPVFPAASRKPGQGDEIVVLSPFEVLSDSDLGYRAANSVSATRIALPIRQLPMTVSAFTEAFIEDQKAYDLYDIVKWAPGVHQDNVSPQGWVRYNIRGFTSAAVQRNGFGSFRFIDTTNIARVEVVKGPASLLYGQINPGGVINYITKRPEARPRVQVTASAGDRGYTRAVVDATGPVPGTRGKLLYRAIAMSEDIQQFQVLAHGKKHLFAPSLTFNFSDHTMLTVDFEHFERLEDMLTGGVILIYDDGIPTVPYPRLPWDFSYAGAGDFQDFISDAFSAEFTTRIGERLNLRATYLDAYWDMEWRATGQGGTGLLPQPFIDHYYPPGAGLTSAHAMYRRNRWEHQWGGERTAQIDALSRFEIGGVQLTALAGYKRNFDTRLRGVQKNNPNVAGSPFYLKPWDLRNPLTWDRAVPFGLESLVLAANARSSSDGSSLFGVITATALDERLRLLGGYARHELHNDPTYNFVAGTMTSATHRAADVPQAGALLELTKGLGAFISYSESFLANTNMLRVNNVPTTPASPSLGRGWEAGLKLDLLDGRFSGTISAYRVQARPTGIVTVTSGVDSSGTTLFTDIQGGSQLSQGFELDLLFAPIDALQVMVGFSRCDAVYERHPTNAAFDGTPLVATPDRTFSLWGKYIFQSGPLHGFTLAGGFSYVGDMAYVSNNPLVRTASYATIDLTLGYRFQIFGRKCTADLAIKNLTDERYYASSSSWGFPRHAMLSLSTRF